MHGVGISSGVGSMGGSRGTIVGGREALTEGGIGTPIHEEKSMEEEK